MRLPEIQLDDRRFQDLVSEARTRISRACPEWTEHNVSDPGITLIELFAWMTEMTIYRLNRVPDKLHVALLDLLGIRLDGPSAATTSLRFRLADAPLGADPDPRRRDRGRHAAHRATTRRSSSRSTRTSRSRATRPAAYVLQRHGQQAKSVGMAEGEARPQGPDQLAFGTPPQVGDALYLGFEDPLDRLIIRIDVEASPARGAGVEPEGSAAALGGLPGRQRVGARDRARRLHRRLQLRRRPDRARAAAALGGRPARRAPAALAALPDRRTRRMTGRETQIYAHAPEIASITRRADGRAPARHARRPRSSARSSASRTARPGQIFPLRHHPVLKLGTGETLEVQDPESGDWARWEPRDDFVGSTEFDRHFVVDLVSGEVEFGPAIRETSGALDAVRRGPAQGRGAALHALPPRRRPRRQRHRRVADRAQEHDRRRRHGHQPGRRAAAASTPRSSPTPASARRWRSARATAPSPPRTSSSWPARRARASRAPSASRRATAAPCRCTSCRASTRPTGACTSTS